MKQEDREILLTELCARLPYGVKCKLSANGESLVEDLQLGGLSQFLYGRLDVLPYLRPMSSMTTEERIYYHDLCTWSDVAHYEFGELGTAIQYYDTWESIDYLNSIHVDYRGLIPMGLAIEVTEENNPYKE